MKTPGTGPVPFAGRVPEKGGHPEHPSLSPRPPRPPEQQNSLSSRTHAGWVRASFPLVEDGLCYLIGIVNRLDRGFHLGLVRVLQSHDEDGHLSTELLHSRIKLGLAFG